MLKKIVIASLFSSSALAASHKITFDSSDVCQIDGRKVFPLSVAVIPQPDGKTPDGKSAWQEFSDAGINFARIAPGDAGIREDWNDEGLKTADADMQQFADAKICAWMTIGMDLSYVKPNDEKAQERLKALIKRFQNDPAMAAWKGADEPQWGNMNTKGKKPPASIATTYKIVHEMDPNHPVMVIQAPRGTAADNAAYDPYLDVTGMDIFPISYPPGRHVPDWPNKEISMVGDWTKIIVQAAHGKPVWMTLQVAWSGVSRPDKNTLRFPTFAQERFMTYQAIINGARGLNYFGGGIKIDLNDRDSQLGYDWTFWDRILKPLLTELNDKSPLHDALIAPDSKLPIKAEGGEGVELLTREVGDDIYLLVCKREGATVEVKFSGLPTNISTGDVLYEEPRKIAVKDGGFSDWFAPFDVHVYHFTRAGK